MKPGKDPVVVDLAARRKAARKAQAAARKPIKKPNEPLLGGRPQAGLILALVAAVCLALWLLPKLF